MVVVYLPQLSNEMSIFGHVVGMIHHVAHETLGAEKKQTNQQIIHKKYQLIFDQITI
jgi:hypothetical protein